MAVDANQNHLQIQPPSSAAMAMGLAPPPELEPFPSAPLPKRCASLKASEGPAKTRKRSRTGGSKDLYEGHSQDVMLAKALIDPDHQCSVTTVKAYVTHVCAWFRYCRTLSEPNYTLVNEEKLSGFLTWATQTPRLPCKTGSGGSMSYQSARRYVEGGILALWRRYRKPDDENPLHALSYLSTKYAIREATGNKPKAQPEKHFSAYMVSQEQEDSIVRSLLSATSDPCTSIKAWAYYCLGASTWIPGNRRLHLRLDSLAMSQRTDARLVEHTTVPFLEFRVTPDPASRVGRFAEVSIARHTNPMLCPWYAIAMLIFSQWQASPSAMAKASLYDVTTWLSQPLFLASSSDSLVFLSDEARVQMLTDEVSPLMAQVHELVGAPANDSHIIRKRDKIMAEGLGLSAPQVVRLEKWRIHHRRSGVTRAQTFFDLTLVLGGQNPPSAHSAVSNTFRAPARTRLQVPEHLVNMVFPWIGEWAVKQQQQQQQHHSGLSASAGARAGYNARPRSHSMSAQHSDDVARAERSASLKLMRELATVLLQDTAAMLADPQCARIIEANPVFSAPVFASRAFRDFSAYAAQALSLQHIDMYMHVPRPLANDVAAATEPPAPSSCINPSIAAAAAAAAAAVTTIPHHPAPPVQVFGRQHSRTFAAGSVPNIQNNVAVAHAFATTMGLNGSRQASANARQQQQQAFPSLPTTISGSASQEIISVPHSASPYASAGRVDGSIVAAAAAAAAAVNIGPRGSSGEPLMVVPDTSDPGRVQPFPQLPAFPALEPPPFSSVTPPIPSIRGGRRRAASNRIEFETIGEAIEFPPPPPQSMGMAPQQQQQQFCGNPLIGHPFQFTAGPQQTVFPSLVDVPPPACHQMQMAQVGNGDLNSQDLVQLINYISAFNGNRQQPVAPIKQAEVSSSSSSSSKSSSPSLVNPPSDFAIAPYKLQLKTDDELFLR